MQAGEFFGWNFAEFFTAERIASLVRLAIWLFIGLPGIYYLSRITRRYVAKKYSSQQALIFSKLVLYSGLIFLVVSILNEFGFKLTHLLTAAGILGVAIGFASQTSFSNIISGLFIMGEQPFVIDDIISVSGITGQVLSIDMLSVKIRTFDNRFVRIPNELILKSDVTNNTYFPIRRLDIQIGVAYKEDITRVREVLFEVAFANPLCLQEPEPLVIFQGYGNSSIDLQFSVWVKKSDYLKLKNSIQEEIKQKFDELGIEIPFPHLSLYTGSVTDPFPVRVVSGRNSAKKSPA